MVLYDILGSGDDQIFMIYATEIQSQSKSVLEYMELVGEFLRLTELGVAHAGIPGGVVMLAVALERQRDRSEDAERPGAWLRRMICVGGIAVGVDSDQLALLDQALADGGSM